LAKSKIKVRSKDKIKGDAGLLVSPICPASCRLPGIKRAGIRAASHV
jgi:hypothetical protein